MLKTIFWFEWRQFVRQPTQLLTWLFFLFLGVYSVHNGKAFITQQFVGIDSLQHNQKQHLQEAIDRFHSDTNTPKGKAMAEQAGIPQVVEFRAAPVAINPPHPLALLSIGQRDLLPYFDPITIKRDVFSSPNKEIANPEKLASGNFDFAFVLVFLFPLLIIVLCYDIYAKEVEQQTDRLLAIQGANLNRILWYKLLFRFCLVILLAWLISIYGIYISPVPGPFPLTATAIWLYSVLTYLVFWFTICWMMTSLVRSSRITALSLLGIWLLLGIVLPAVSNKVCGVIRPIPLRTALASSQREVMDHTWEMPIPELINIFYKNNPQYTSIRSASDTAKYGNKRFAAYYDLLSRRMDSNIKKYKDAIEEHNSLLTFTTLFNPTAQSQQLFNTSAQTGLADYLWYLNQVNSFQSQWVLYMNGFMLYNKRMSIHDVQHLPRFHFQQNQTISQKLLHMSVPIWLASLLVLSLAYCLKISKPTHI